MFIICIHYYCVQQLKTMDFLNLPTTYSWDRSGTRPDMFRLFSDVVDFAQNTIYQVKPRHVGSFTTTTTTMGNSHTISDPLIFEEPSTPFAISKKNLGLEYTVRYKTYKYDENQLSIYYFTGDEQSITVQICNPSRDNYKDKMMCVPKNIRRKRKVNTWRVDFVIDDIEDFFYLFKKWLYFDHNDNWDNFKQNFGQLLEQFNDQKHYEINTAPQFLEMMKKARERRQPIHEVFRNEDTTNRIVRAGFSIRRHS